MGSGVGGNAHCPSYGIRIISILVLQMLIFDIGANIGRYALSNYQPSDNIICVEASPSTFRTLCNNTNNHNNIKCINFAVTNSSEDYVTFYDSPINTISTLDKAWLSDTSSRFYGTHYNEILVPTISIDRLIETYGIPDILKIDVEGAENIVIKSLSKKCNILCFEWATEWNAKTFECIDHLHMLGYDKFHIQMGDAYTYRPSIFEYSVNQLKEKLTTTKNKIDWGMIWTA
jgi:FkbM family methyltransferase